MKKLAAVLVIVASLGATSDALSDDGCGKEIGTFLNGKSDAPWKVQIQLKPEDIPLNAPFGATVTICSKSEELPVRIDVDAVMPAHKHGMNYEPKTVQINHYRYEVKNLLFHMPGVWRLEITIFEKDKPHRFIHDVQLK